MSSTSNRALYWLSGVFISAVLVVLVAVPLVISFQTTTLTTKMSELAEPADKMGAEIQGALSHELSGIVGFQTTGQEKYVESYWQQAEIIEKALDQLDHIDAELGAPFQARVYKIRSMVYSWHRHVQDHDLLTVQRPKGGFSERFFKREYIFEGARQATTEFNEALSEWRIEQRGKLQKLNHLTTTLSIVFALPAVSAVVLVVAILRRLNATLDELRHAVQVSESAVRGRDEILRVVSHDLRSPLHNIQMTAEVLVTSPPVGEQHDRMVRIIKRSTERMNRLIEDLVAAARVRERQAIPIELRPENAGEIIKEACETAKIQAGAKSIEVRCEEPNTLPLINADRHRILQVLSNLLDNAVKFTPEGGTIRVRCNVDQANEWQVRFSVSDTGRGIERQNLGRIFELFWQASSTAHMGTGLGLPIAKAIVEQHGGTIWAESEPGKGTTFFFTLPVFLS